MSYGCDYKALNERFPVPDILIKDLGRRKPGKGTAYRNIGPQPISSARSPAS
jgi:hypothetical protein